MNPIEALDKAIMYCMAIDPRKPGEVIKRLPKEIREALEKLTSDDALKMRIFYKK